MILAKDYKKQNTLTMNFYRGRFFLLLVLLVSEGTHAAENDCLKDNLRTQKPFNGLWGPRANALALPPGVGIIDTDLPFCPKIGETRLDRQETDEEGTYGAVIQAAANMKRIFKVDGKYFEVTFPYVGTTTHPDPRFPVNKPSEKIDNVSDYLQRFRYFKYKFANRVLTFAAPQDYFLCSSGGQAHGVPYDGVDSDPKYRLSDPFHQNFLAKNEKRMPALAARPLSQREIDLMVAKDNLRADFTNCDPLMLGTPEAKAKCTSLLEKAESMKNECVKLTRQLPELKELIDRLNSTIPKMRQNLDTKVPPGSGLPPPAGVAR